ncbi:phosphonopyruvate decarboxylase domain protein, partial [Bacteroides fragilis str. 3998T(B)3]
LLLLVGWRGEPGVKDEPQHIKQGKVTIPLFDSMRIKNQILSKDKSDFLQQLNVALEYIRETNEPFVFIIQKETFSDYKLQTPNNNALLLDRETAIKIIVSSISKNDIVVST